MQCFAAWEGGGKKGTEWSKAFRLLCNLTPRIWIYKTERVYALLTPMVTVLQMVPSLQCYVLHFEERGSVQAFSKGNINSSCQVCCNYKGLWFCARSQPHCCKCSSFMLLVPKSYRFPLNFHTDNKKNGWNEIRLLTLLSLWFHTLFSEWWIIQTARQVFALNQSHQP